MSFCVRSITWKKVIFCTGSTCESKIWPRLHDVQGREANTAPLNGSIDPWHRVRAPTLPVHQHWHSSFYRTWQTRHFLRTKDFWQPCLKQIYQCPFFQQHFSFHVSVSHFSNSHISNFLSSSPLFWWSGISELCRCCDSLKVRQWSVLPAMKHSHIQVRALL